MYQFKHLQTVFWWRTIRNIRILIKEDKKDDNNKGDDKKDDDKKDDNKKDDTGNSDKGSDAGNNTGNGVGIAGEDTENPNRYDTGIKAKDNSLITVDDSGNLISIDKNNKVTILDRNAKYKLTTDKNGKVLLL